MPTLKQISRTMLEHARQAEERPVRRYLPNGLLVTVAQMKTGDVVLTLERRDVDPSRSEWDTVIKYWAEPVPPGVVPTSRTDGRFHRLIGRWPRPAMLGEAFKTA